MFWAGFTFCFGVIAALLTWRYGVRPTLRWIYVNRGWVYPVTVTVVGVIGFAIYAWYGTMRH